MIKSRNGDDKVDEQKTHTHTQQSELKLDASKEKLATN